MRKIRWIKPPDGLRHEGMIEKNDADLCAAWVKAGIAEYVDEDEKTHAEDQADDLDQRRRPVEEKAVYESPVDRAMKPAAGKTKKR